MYKKINFYQHIRITSGAASRWLCTRFFQEIYWHIMVLFFWITIFKILAIVIIALPILGLLFPKNPTWKLSNFMKFLLILELFLITFIQNHDYVIDNNIILFIYCKNLISSWNNNIFCFRMDCWIMSKDLKSAMMKLTLRRYSILNLRRKFPMIMWNANVEIWWRRKV